MAHLHLLLASEGHGAVLLKHGPGRGSCSLGWDRRNDQIELAQCLRSRIQFSDLSPDGQHLVYSVNKQRYGVEHSVYTVVSRAPWLKALTFWSGNGEFGTHPSLGTFYRDDVGRVALFVGSMHGLRWNHIELPIRTERPAAWRDFSLDGQRFDRLQRDGWEVTSDFERVDREQVAHVASWRGSSIHRAVFRKPLLYGWALERTYWSGNHQDIDRGNAFETFVVLSPDKKRLLGESWVSADWDASRQRLVWTVDNQLFAAPLDVDGLGEPRQLYDAREVRFVARKAPY